MPVSFLASVLGAAMVYFAARAVGWRLEDVETQEELLGSAPILAGLVAGAVAAIVTIIPAAGAGVLSDQLLLHYVAGSLGTAGSFMFTIACAEIMVHEETGDDRWEPRLAEDVVQKLGLRGDVS